MRCGVGQTLCLPCYSGSPDLKTLTQASKAPTATGALSPAVEQMQPVMASDLPATPGRT